MSLALILRLLPIGLMLLAIGGLLYYRGEYRACQTAIVAERLAAREKADEVLASARADSDRRIASLQVDLDTNRATADTYREMVANAQPASATCPPSPASRASSRGVRATINGENSGGSPPAK